MKRFGFANEAAEREYRKLPDDVQDQFGKDLRRIQFGQDPEMPIEHLSDIDEIIRQAYF